MLNIARFASLLIALSVFTVDAGEVVLNNLALHPFWQKHVTFGQFKGVDEVTIIYAKVPHPAPRATMMILPGRGEAFLKYRELVADFKAQGFQIFLMDQRGQGLSGRLLDDPMKGHVEAFSDYAEDVSRFLQAVVLPQQHGELYLLAHSMGGGIAIQTLADHPETFDAAVLVAPMIQPNVGLPLGCYMVQPVAWFCANCSTPSANPGSEEKAFAINRLTHSKPRFMEYRALLKTIPEIKLGAPTFGWVREACSIAEPLMLAAERIDTPVLLLQAGEEKVVESAPQDAFCAQLNAFGNPVCKDGAPRVIDGARHEILFESDPMRERALAEIKSHFQPRKR